MNNFDLEKFLKETECNPNISVIPCDQLLVDKPLPLNSAVIVNLDSSDLPGSHWVLFFTPDSAQKHCDWKLQNVEDETPLIWFDSLGIAKKSFYPQFNKFFTNYHPILSNNSQPVQEIDRFSESCGMYCLYVAIRLCRGENFYSIMNTFEDHDLNFNECLVLDFLNKCYKTKHFNKYIGCKRV